MLPKYLLIKPDFIGPLISRRAAQLSVNCSRHLYFETSQRKSTLLVLNSEHPLRNLSTNVESSDPTKANKIDEFRAREEKKEEEYEKDQEPPPEENREEHTKAIRTKILEASLPFVSTHGWTKKAIAEGAEAVGYPAVAHGMFPEGGIELLRYFCNKCNEELVKRLKAETNNGETISKDTLEFLIFAVKLRLQMIEPYIAHWPQALAIMSLPQNVPTSLAQILTMVDDICYYAGDRSVDFAWYTRRVGLAGIFKMAELYMLQDSSMEHQATWTFLRKRMEEATQLEDLLIKSEGITQNVQKTLSSAFITARNILGLGYDRR